MIASVAVAAVVVTTVAAAAVATLLLLGAAVSAAVKMGVMQTAPIASSRGARRYRSPARLAQKFETLGLFVARLTAVITASLKHRRRRHT